jgi:hypothetical protein
MDFPVADLLDEELSEQWLLKHFHPEGVEVPTLRCAPIAGAAVPRGA